MRLHKQLLIATLDNAVHQVPKAALDPIPALSVSQRCELKRCV